MASLSFWADSSEDLFFTVELLLGCILGWGYARPPLRGCTSLAPVAPGQSPVSAVVEALNFD